jgi:NADPH2:quinone reductase
MPFKVGGAFLASHLTAYLALHRRARLRRGETVLVTAAAGSLGSAATRIARAAGARVVAVVGTPSKVEVARRLGADVALAAGDTDLVAAVREFTGGRGVDVALDMVGGDFFKQLVRVMAFEGRLVVVGFTGGAIPELAMNHPLLKNYAVLGMHVNLYLDHQPAVVRRAVAALLELYGSGQVEPLIAHTFPFEQAPAALEAIAARQTVGKPVVLRELRP